MPKQKFTMPDGELTERDMPVWKTPYNFDTNFESERTALYCADPSKTKQEFKDETDINVILARFTRTGETPPVILPEHFADLTNRTTYFDMASAAADANELFYLLPASTRAEHLNDPTRWADAVVQALEQGNRESLEKLGIATSPAAPQGANQGTPPTPDTPAAQASLAPPGGATGGTPPQPPSDTGKK